MLIWPVAGLNCGGAAISKRKGSSYAIDKGGLTPFYLSLLVFDTGVQDLNRTCQIDRYVPLEHWAGVKGHGGSFGAGRDVSSRTSNTAEKGCAIRTPPEYIQEATHAQI
jgi:hypothetical protein